MKRTLMLLVLFLSCAIISWCVSSTTSEDNPINGTPLKENKYTIPESRNGLWKLNLWNLFTDKDLNQTPNLDKATYYKLSDNKDIFITKKWVYAIQWKANDVTIYVEGSKEDKIQIVLDWVDIKNKDHPCIYVKQADKVFITTTDSENILEVTEWFMEIDGTKTTGVIFSKDDITLNGIGTLTVKSTKNGIVWKDDIKITWWTYNITAFKKAIDANDSIRILDWNFILEAWTDWLHAENKSDDKLWYIYIWWGNFTMDIWDDGIHWMSIVQIDSGNISIRWPEWIEWTYVQINWWNIEISGNDDWINTASKSKSLEVALEVNGWYTKIRMWAWDTDWIDSNWNIYLHGWVVDIVARAPADYLGAVVYDGGSLIIEWVEYDHIPNQRMRTR